MRQSKINFKNEKDLIYGFKSEGSYLPKYNYCKVYKNGVVDYGEGWLIDVDEHIDGRKSISDEAVAKIQKVISDNSEILSIKELESEGQFMVTDAATDTFYFSDGQRENTLSVYAFWTWERSEYLSNYTKMALLVKVHKRIRKILLSEGVKEEYC